MIAIVRAIGLVTIQDLGRPGHMHEAVPPGGALVPELLVMANRAAHNPAGAAAIEVLGRLVVRAESADLLVATDAARARVLRAGEELEIASRQRAAYLAVRGGVEAPLVLGGRGTLLCAGLGAPLRQGDRITAGSEPETASDSEPVLGPGAGPVRVIPGPDGEGFSPRAIDALVSATYRVLPSSDRVGTRLDGPRIARAEGWVERSRPMVRGAIEVPRDEKPIVLGPEHPTTGGYPLVAIIATPDLGRFFSIPLGGTVRFFV